MNQKARYYLSLVSLGIGGSSIFLLMYVRYVFYDQMIETMGISNTQIGLLTTMSSFVGFVLTIPSGFIADHFDSKRLIIIALSSTAALCFIFAAFTTYPVAIAVWIGLGFSTGLGYWPSLIKFINGLAGPEDS